MPFGLQDECSAKGGNKRAKTPLQVALVKASVDIEVAAVGRRGGKLVAALVELMAGVTLNPDELNLVLAFGGEQALPQIAVLDRLLVGGLPAAFFQPSIQCLLKALTTYCESEWTSTSQGRLSASSATITAMSSMRLLVVLA